MNMRLLSTRKDSKRREWVVMKDPVTGEEAPKHYSLDSFNQHKRVYPYFFKRNNNVVRVAIEWGIDLGNDYDRFFQQGLRVSQQISVPTKSVGFFDERPKTFADICEEDLNKRARALEERLLEEVRRVKKGRRNSQYDSILPVLEEGTLPEELQSARNLVARLKETDIIEHSSQFGEPSFEEKANYLREDKNSELLRVLPEVDASLRHLFLHVVKYGELNGSRRDWFEQELEGLSGFLEFIGPECGRSHLGSLLTSLQRNENIYELRQSVNYYNGSVRREQFGEYFASVRDIQGLGYKGDTAVSLTVAKLKLPVEQRGKYDVVLKKITDAGVRTLTLMMMNRIVEKTPEFLEDPKLVDRVIDVYKTHGDERRAYMNLYL